MIYEFGRFQLDTTAHELRDGDRPVDVEPQVFDVILYLVERAGELVTRDELVDSVWKGRPVADTTISSRIKAARRVLGDDGQAQALIRTIQRRGFKFLSEVRAVPTDPGCSFEPHPPTTIDTRPFGSEARPSVAVLPFANLSGEPALELIADGIVEDVIAGLSRFRSLFVINRGSTFAYKNQSARATEVAQDLGVRYVVEGSVRGARDVMRVSFQLVDASTGVTLASERIDSAFDDVFELQERIAAKVLSIVAPEIEADERARVQRHPPNDLNAWELYQRGLWIILRIDPETFSNGISLLEEAIERDPGLACARAQLAYSLTNGLRFGYDWDRDELLRRVGELADSAKSLDANEALAYVAKSRLLCITGNAELGLEEAMAAAAINPNSSRVQQGVGWVLGNVMGRHGEAVPYYLTALRLSPMDPQRGIVMVQLASNYRCLGEYATAIRYSRRGLELIPKFYLPRITLALALHQDGQHEAAQHELGVVRELRPGLKLEAFRESGYLNGHAFVASAAPLLEEMGLP